jgi:hypothetical protein
VSAFALDLLLQFFACIAVTTYDDRDRALDSTGPNDRRTDALSSTGNNDDLVF